MNRLRIFAPACVALLGWTLLSADEAPTNRPFFLPKSPTAAAYVLGRLSSSELIAAPRSEFVYVALLHRPGLERKYRLEALDGLAQLRHTDRLTELLAGLGELDKKGAATEPVLRDLAPILLQTSPDRLQPQQPALTRLTTDGRLDLTRQIAYAALLTLEGVDGPIWPAAAAQPRQFADLLLSLPLIRDAQTRAAFYPKVAPLLQSSEPAEVRRAAITTISSLPGHDAETFRALARLFHAGTERSAAIASLQRLPRQAWPSEQAATLIPELIAYLQALPVAQRTAPEAVSAFQFASDLTALLPADQASAFSKTLRSLGVRVFVIRTVPEQMRYDQSLIVVEAGQPVELVLINDDAMPHNLVVVAPGGLEAIGNAAEKLPPTPDARGRLYIPDSPQALHATKLVESGHREHLSFTAPVTPGEYPFVCTFPGHWRRMNGTLAVVRDVEAYLASHAARPPKITEWKLEDLAPTLTRLNADRDLRRGQELFTKLSCASCHKLGAEGASFGPELTTVFAQHHNDAAEVLRQILEPSLIISNQFRAYQFELNNGDEVSGLIVKEDGDNLTVQSGASAALIQTIKKSEVKSQQPQRSSLMPTALLNQLSAEEILDLLAFVQAGGKVPAHAHQH